jgi:hypothetical protein
MPGHTAVVERLIRAGASVGFKNLHGMTALTAAAAGQHIGTVRVLAAAGANVDAKDRNGTTALHVAAREGRSAVAAALLELGANPTVVNGDGSTPADLARRRRDFDMVTLIGKHEAELAAAGKLDKNNARGAGAGGSEHGHGQDDEEEEPPQVVMVSRVRHKGNVFLVDKRTGIVYSNDLDNPTQVTVPTVASFLPCSPFCPIILIFSPLVTAHSGHCTPLTTRPINADRHVDRVTRRRAGRP